MLGAFAEAVRATAQPCTLLLLVPMVAAVLATRCRWRSLAATAAGAVAGGWVFAAGLFVLDGWRLRLTGGAVAVVLVLLVLAPVRRSLRPITGGPVEAGAVGLIAFAATLWWRPCVGSELGAVLTAARNGVAGQLPGMAAYMLGVVVPVAGIVLLGNAVRGRVVSAAAWAGSAAGVVIAGALALGRHGDLVESLTRWTTA